MVVRPVQIDEQITQLLEHGERRGRAVDELPVAARLGKRALDDERTPSTQPSRPCPSSWESSAWQSSTSKAASTVQESEPVRICPLSARSPEQQLERADDHGFARARFAGDGDEAGAQLPVEFFDQREVFDPQRGQRCEHGARV